MALFQNSVLKKYLVSQTAQPIQEAFAQYQSYFHNAQIRENIRAAKEEQFLEGFLRELFVNILGYTINPEPEYNLTTELKNWPSLDFKGFLGELKKAKAHLSLSEEAEWMGYFNEQKSKAQAHQTDITRLDCENDVLVYELYGLTEEEIRIVEGN
jgi:hypothetical protein